MTVLNVSKISHEAINYICQLRRGNIPHSGGFFFLHLFGFGYDKKMVSLAIVTTSFPCRGEEGGGGGGYN